MAKEDNILNEIKLTLRSFVLKWKLKKREKETQIFEKKIFRKSYRNYYLSYIPFHHEFHILYPLLSYAE